MDDHHHVEPKASVAQAWVLLKDFYALLGPRLATPGGPKFPLPSQTYKLLGTTPCLSVDPREVRILPSRSEEICRELRHVLESNRLTCGHASEIFGKLSFSAGQLFGRFGRRYLGPFKARQYAPAGMVHLSQEITRAIHFWLRVLPKGPFRAVPPGPGTPLVISIAMVRAPAA